METKVILSAGLIAAYGLTHVVAGIDVPGKPLTLLNGFVSTSTSSSNTAANLVVANLANPYGSDFVLPATDPRPKITLKSST
jgi:hypothetical protein